MKQTGGAQGALDDFLAGFGHMYGIGREDRNLAFYRGRTLAEKDQNAVRLSTTLGTIPTFTTTRELLGIADKNQVEARRERGFDIDSSTRGRVGANRAEKIGKVMGAFGADLTQDSVRSLWWLLNAPQATANIINEIALNKAAPELYEAEQVKYRGKPIPVLKTDDQGNPITRGESYQAAVNKGLINKGGNMQAGVGQVKGKYVRRKFAPGHVAALGILPGAAINQGLGLMSPFGGTGGYEAVIPSQEDPTKSANVLGEIATKYFLGRTGNLLPYEEFRKVRPDVSKAEYNAYKAYKWDKKGDLDITDGDFNLPGGILKGTTDGIHGAEINFLGKSLPVNTALMPFATTVGGTVAGLRLGQRGGRANVMRGGLGGAALGYIGGQAAGIALEAMRRNRNMEMSAPITSPLDPESTSIGL